MTVVKKKIDIVLAGLGDSVGQSGFTSAKPGYTLAVKYRVTSFAGCKLPN